MNPIHLLQEDSVPWVWFDYGSNLIFNKAVIEFATFEKWMQAQGLVYLVDYHYGYKMDFFYLAPGVSAIELEFKSVPTAVKIRDREIVSLAIITFPFLKSDGPTYLP